MIVKPYEAEHLLMLNLQEGQAYLGAHVNRRLAASLEHLESAFTGFDDDGRVLICAGVLPMWSGRGVCWAYVDETAGRQWLAIHHAVKRFLRGYLIHRLEATVDCDFEPGHRWVRALGFEIETPRMRGYRVDGGDCAMYVRMQ